MMRAAIIVNPAKSDVADLREQVDKTLAAAGWSTSLWLETTPEDPGPGMAQAAVEAGVQLVVICGGDGTLLACLAHLGRHQTCRSRCSRSAPAICSPATWACRPELDDALAVALDGVDRRIDCGRVGDQPFAVMAGIGFDAAMMADATERMKRFAGWPAYVASGLRHLRDPMMRVRLRIDDGPPMRRPARTVLIGNVGRLQGGLELSARRGGRRRPARCGRGGAADPARLDPVGVEGDSPPSHAASASRTLPRPLGPGRGRPNRAPADGRRGHRRRAESQRAYRARRSGSPRAAAGGDGGVTE